jgi:hypothetical protein
MKTITVTFTVEEVVEALKQGGKKFGLVLKKDLDLDQLQEVFSEDLKISTDLEDFFVDGINHEVYDDFFEEES